MAHSEKPRPKLKDVARLAGVGTATVDRVLNERGSVSEEVRRKVIEVAREIGLRRQLPPSYMPLIRINLVLARPHLPLLQRMATEFRELTKTIDRRVRLQITKLRDEDPDTIGDAMRTTQCNAVVVYAQDSAVIRAAIADLELRGIPVITIISDLPNSKRLAYAGTDHNAAGRTTGYFLSSMIPAGGPMIVVCNQLMFNSHSERVSGLRSFLAERAPHLVIERVIEGLDDRERTRTRLEAAFQECPETVAVYNVGAANLGVRAAIEADILPRRPLFVGHELTVHTTQMLRDGLMTVALDQNPRLQARFTLDVLLDHFGYEGMSVTRPYTSNVPFVLYSPENIPNGPDGMIPTP
ncbi:LacI family DNA-binding transcriptional regulator [Kordiimonas sp.]|uniref:LacI family DNA-binding transcriptional regulator n=1 Tax=Kordiimonas sp. TaxID=1970157 RepID=UPI003A90D868